MVPIRINEGPLRVPSSEERGNWRERLRAVAGRGTNGNKPTAQGIVRSNVWGRRKPLHASYAYSVRTLGCRVNGAVSAMRVASVTRRDPMPGPWIP